MPLEVRLTLKQMVQPPWPFNREERLDEKRLRVAPVSAQRARKQVDYNIRQDEGKVNISQFRSDNSIKNYFYSMIRRNLRRMGKLLGSKNSTGLMR